MSAANDASIASLIATLYRYDVLSLRTFLAVSNSELDLLAFCQRLEAVARDSAEVGKYVRT